MIPGKQCLLIQFFAYHHNANIISKFCMVHFTRAGFLTAGGLAPATEGEDPSASSSNLPSWKHHTNEFLQGKAQSCLMFNGQSGLSFMSDV